MTNEEAQIIIGNIPIKPEALDDCYSIAEYQEAKAMAIKALEQQQDVHDTCIEEYPTCTECEHYDREKHYCPRFCQVIKDSLAEAQPKKGKWVNVSPISYICSCCSYGVGRWNNTSYCPNCGAEMGGADETN